MNDHLNELWALMYSEIPKYVKLTESSIKLWFGTISLRYMSDTRLYFEIDNYLKITYLEVFRRMFIEQPEKYLTDKFEGYTLKDVLFS